MKRQPRPLRPGRLSSLVTTLGQAADDAADDGRDMLRQPDFLEQVAQAKEVCVKCLYDARSLRYQAVGLGGQVAVLGL
jgi:hypothetical protein